MAQKYAVCPFYQHETEVSVVCEGVEGAKSFVVKFKNSNDAWFFRERFCKELDNYTSCPVCRALMTAWGCFE